MKLIIAIIRPEELEAVQTGLDKRVACFMSVSQILGYGPESGEVGSYRGAQFRVRRVKLRLAIALDDEFVEAAVEVIQGATAMGDPDQLADRNVFVIGDG